MIDPRLFVWGHKPIYTEEGNKEKKKAGKAHVHERRRRAQTKKDRRAPLFQPSDRTPVLQDARAAQPTLPSNPKLALTTTLAVADPKRHDEKRNSACTPARRGLPTGPTLRLHTRQKTRATKTATPHPVAVKSADWPRLAEPQAPELRRLHLSVSLLRRTTREGKTTAIAITRARCSVRSTPERAIGSALERIRRLVGLGRVFEG